MYSTDLNRKVAAPLLSEDDSFNSQPLLGFLVYRIPAPGALFGTSEDTFDTFYTMSFDITV